MKYTRDLIPEIDELATRKRENYPEITDDDFWRFFELAAPYSMVHITGFYNVYQTLRYLAANGIPGDLVECGCFLGGVAIFMGLMRRHLGLEGKRIWLYDTFEAAPVGATDIRIASGRSETRKRPDPNYYSAVRDNIVEVVGTIEGYVLVPGAVEETLPHSEHGEIALLRLDTDYYPSTKIEFEVLYPKLVRGGALIVDDYGIYHGARRATEEYLQTQDRRPLLNRIDDGIWAGVKP